jgi:hypothetical protein
MMAVRSPNTSTRSGSGIDGGGNVLYFSHPNPAPNTAVAPAVLRALGANVNLTGRDHMTLWRCGTAKVLVVLAIHLFVAARGVVRIESRGRA